mmetsp:Transcript_363/g.487  ORF Transcript_363/g.487 Transcript_363/m.487 type:complete len:145 (+) Transcript_363:199-633(+)|eukprot:CAMPEP_0198136734 /NCGR_PEP_ID=MMETSP1443-20131203/351_1 /TAXON_ID=186043 /ORGANISM="Entomoneis sp., Strain CCMP2396" /LENGTH=144 /DNA_ID=CAMNT_0043798005 /DNA_START=170 /DNA_END=604 /DNA_ORIENTATION=+
MRSFLIASIATLSFFLQGAAAVEPVQVQFHLPEESVVDDSSLGHYGKPPEGCTDDETVLQIQGVPGVICAPKCADFMPCPSDLPDGVSATPQCALKDQAGHQYCILMCSPGEESSNLRAGDGQCGPDATCQPVQGLGVCTYPLD